MTLVLLILLPLIGGLAVWHVGRRNADACRWFSLVIVSTELVLALRLWARHFHAAELGSAGPWLEIVERVLATEVNESLADSPETVNSDAYGEGWLFRLQPADAGEMAGLMDGDAYEAFLATEAH